VKTFHMSFPRPFALVFLSTAAVGLPFYVVLPVLSAVPIAIFIVGIAASAAAWTGLIIWQLKVRVDAEGVHATDLWGLPRSVGWTDIDRVKPCRFFNLSYLRVFPVDGTRPLWLPTFISNREAFQRAVNELAPTENPVGQRLGGSSLR